VRVEGGVSRWDASAVHLSSPGVELAIRERPGPA
jgi:hypothetical protein